MTDGVLSTETPVSIAVDNTRRLRGYFRDAHGPVGVFVHGFRSHCGGEKSLALAEYAAIRRRPWLRFDLSSHGLSDGTFDEFRVSKALRDLETVLDWLGGRSVVLVGSSLGGWLCALAALRHPKRVRGALLMAPAFNFVRYYLALLPEAERAQWQATGKRTFEDRYGGPPFTVDYETVTDALAYDVYASPLRFGCPLEIIHGADDEVVPVASSREFVRRAAAPWLRLTEVPGGDHRLSDRIPLLCEHIDGLWRRIEEKT